MNTCENLYNDTKKLNTVFTRVQVAPKYKTHPNFCLDVLVSGQIEMIEILRSWKRRTPTGTSGPQGCVLYTGGYGTYKQACTSESAFEPNKRK